MDDLPLFRAVESGDLEAVHSILGEDPELVHARTPGGATPLHLATLGGHREIARLLIGHGANPNAIDHRFGATPAGWAIEYLRAHSAFLATELDDLAWAVQERHVPLVRRLLERFPALRDESTLDGPTFRELAETSRDPEIRSLFSEDPGES